MNSNEVITYEEVVVFNYTLPDEDELKVIQRELTLVWEDSLDKFFEEKGQDTSYKVHSFKTEASKNIFIGKVENTIDETIEEVEEDIANKTKYGFEFTGQLHNDD